MPPLCRVVTLDRHASYRLIGYENAAKIAKHSVKNDMTVREAVEDLGFVERGEVTSEQLDAALDVYSMTGPKQG